MFYVREIVASLVILFMITLAHPLAAQEVSEKVSVNNPKALIDQNDVRYKKTVRTFRPAKYEGLRKRYETIDGIVMVGVTNAQSQVLLKGPDTWAPPGGEVKPGEDWAAAARRTIKEETGAKIDIESPLLVEHMRFQKKDSEESHFSAYILHFRASPRYEETQFIDNPYANNPPGTFKWFGKVPENAHPNHVSHIKLYLN